jgi:ribonucleoside-diphosphate reductase alpha chain
MQALDFLPNSPTLMNAGTALGQLSACFVLPIQDSMESIFDALRSMALIQRTGGGTGFSFSHLRPSGDLVESTGGTSSGPVSFMKIFDCATENIKLGGKRRGANMAVLRVDHPDIEQFVSAKRDGISLQNFNLSVGVTDQFMDAVRSAADFPLRHPASRREVGRLAASTLFAHICEAAWATGDPGLVFLDAIARANPTPAAGQIECTNPCGEVPLLPYEACNLGSINLVRFVSERNGSAAVDYQQLKGRVHTAVRFLDNVISVNRFPLAAIEKMTIANRKIGLGVMGFAEACILLGLPYASTAALDFAGQLMSFISREARQASALLAEQRGMFPNWPKSIVAARGERLRNATLTSIAPTGTISIIAGTSSGIEPLFALAYRRKNVLGDDTLTELNPLLVRYLESRSLPAGQVLNEVLAKGTLDSVEGIPSDAKTLFQTALSIAPEQHVRMQAAFQNHVDNAVSKTVNLPEEATPQDIEQVYRLAHQLGCKGITVYRYGSKSKQVLELGLNENAEYREKFTKCDPEACRL